MKTFTIIGLYEDTGQTFNGQRVADTAEVAALMVLESHPDETLAVVAVFEGQPVPAYLPEYIERGDDA